MSSRNEWLTISSSIPAIEKWLVALWQFNIYQKSDGVNRTSISTKLPHSDLTVCKSSDFIERIKKLNCETKNLKKEEKIGRLLSMEEDKFVKKSYIEIK